MTEEQQKELAQIFEAIGNNKGNFVIGQVMGTQINYFGTKPQEQANEPKEESGLPAIDQMKKAVQTTIDQGYWWASRAWAVVYRVWQMKGYNGSISEFVREVSEWKLKSDYECNYDAVQKPIASGVLSGLPERWKAQGAQGQAVKLAEALLDELGKV